MPPSAAAIYLDFQASAPVDPSVADSMCDWIRRGCGNPHSAEHAFGWTAREAVERARQLVASLLRADPEDVVFTSGATEANNLALFGAADLAPTGRDTILVSAIEHASVLEPARALEARGFRVVELPVDREGRVLPHLVERELSERVLLVSVGAVNNEVGTLQDIGAIGSLCRSVGALFHTDAAQALPACVLPLGELPVDLASVSSHKAYGPAGIGALYVAPGNAERIRAQVLGGGQQRGLRAGTVPTALCIGFGRACQILEMDGAVERCRVSALRDLLWQQLSMLIPGISLNGPSDFTHRHPGNLSVALPVESRDVVQRLQPNVACSTGSACHSGTDEPSHVLLALGLDDRHARSTLRLSLGRSTTRDDVLQAARLVASAAAAAAVHEDSGPMQTLVS